MIAHYRQYLSHQYPPSSGPSFIDVVRQKQQQNPEYAFLNGGEGSPYFFWALHCELTNTPKDQHPLPPPPFDPFSFPPGLIPKLVQHNTHTTQYAPLKPEDIQHCSVPPPPHTDDYMKARLDKFYAQIADYRPGIAFSDLEADISNTIPGGYHDDHGDAVGVEQLDDGSGGFYGRGGGGTKGLGYGSRSGGGGDDDDDVFQSYRRMRSGTYHSSKK